MKLSFMTFVCPTWDIKRAAAFASHNHYDGIEIRVDAGHQHAISSQSPVERRAEVKKTFAEAGIDIPCVATSVHLASPDAETHAGHMAAARANLVLASDLGAPLVRVFAAGGIPALTQKAAVQVAAALDELGAFAASLGTCPMLECGHDIMKGAAETAEVLKRLQHPNVGALWNHATMDDETFAVMKDRIRHFHVHNDVLKTDNTAILDLARRMKAAGYRGYVSLEIIKGEDLPENMLRETGARLQRQIAEG